jgi:hypothetical protein
MKYNLTLKIICGRPVQKHRIWLHSMSDCRNLRSRPKSSREILQNQKISVFWVVVPCSLVEIYRRFRGACCLHYQGALSMEAASTSDVGKLLPDFKAQPRRQPSSYSPPWEIWNLTLSQDMFTMLRSIRTVDDDGRKVSLMINLGPQRKKNGNDWYRGTFIYISQYVKRTLKIDV